jgi:hypothetical protein
MFVDGDLIRLTQVLANLLNNAAKYTDEGGMIGLSLTQQDGLGMIAVDDNGVGIEADTLHHVFDLFAQADTTLDRARGGLGLGLRLSLGTGGLALPGRWRQCRSLGYLWSEPSSHECWAPGVTCSIVRVHHCCVSHAAVLRRRPVSGSPLRGTRVATDHCQRGKMQMEYPIQFKNFRAGGPAGRLLDQDVVCVNARSARVHKPASR